MIELERITLHLHPSVADPAHIIRWSSVNPLLIKSHGTRTIRFLIWLISKLIHRRLNKTAKRLKRQGRDESILEKVII